MQATLSKPKQITYQRPWLYPKQLGALFCPERYSAIEASTKSGKTLGALVWLTEQAMAGKAGRSYWWIAPIYPQAKIAFRRLKRALPQEVYAANESELTITLVNGAVIWFKGAEKPDSLYGEDVWAAVIDEASRVKEESWHAVRSTITATNGPVRIIGNVKGRRNWAYKMARRAESGEKDMSYHRITAHDAVQAGIITADEVEDARRQLPESVFRELYLAEPSDDEGNPFGLTAIRACIAPLSNGEPVVIGIDLAKSVDYTVIIGLDRMCRVCRFERFQLPWQETMQRIKGMVGKARTIVDSTGVGDPITEQLQRSGLAVEGYHFSAPSKQQLMEGLAVAIQQGYIRFPDGVIVTELESFEYSYSRTGVRYSAMEGMHDDCVCALALAVHGTRPVAIEQERVVFYDSMQLVRGMDL
jgi:phage FluMu gp28-like protein